MAVLDQFVPVMPAVHLSRLAFSIFICVLFVLSVPNHQQVRLMPFLLLPKDVLFHASAHTVPHYEIIHLAHFHISMLIVERIQSVAMAPPHPMALIVTVSLFVIFALSMLTETPLLGVAKSC